MKRSVLIYLLIAGVIKFVEAQPPLPHHDFILALEDRTQNNSLGMLEKVENYFKGHSAQIRKSYLLIEPDYWDDYKGEDNEKNLGTAGKDVARTFRLLNNKGGCSYFFKLSLIGTTQNKSLVLMAWKVDGSSSLKEDPLRILDIDLFAFEIEDVLGPLIKQINHYVNSGVSKDAIYVSQISDFESNCAAYRFGLPLFLLNDDLLDRFYVLKYPTTKEEQYKMPRRIESQFNPKSPPLILFDYWNGRKRVTDVLMVKCGEDDQSCTSKINNYCKKIINQYVNGIFH